MSECEDCRRLQEQIDRLEKRITHEQKMADFWVKRNEYWRSACLVKHNRLQHISRAIRNAKEHPFDYHEKPVNEPSNHLKLVHSA